MKWRNELSYLLYAAGLVLIGACVWKVASLHFSGSTLPELVPHILSLVSMASTMVVLLVVFVVHKRLTDAAEEPVILTAIPEEPSEPKGKMP